MGREDDVIPEVTTSKHSQIRKTCQSKIGYRKNHFLLGKTNFVNDQEKKTSIQSGSVSLEPGLQTSLFLGYFLVTLGVGLEGAGIDDPLVVDHLVTLVVGKGE